MTNTQERVMKLFCTKCGNKLPADAKFCSKCGAQIGEETSGVETKEIIQETPMVDTEILGEENKEEKPKKAKKPRKIMKNLGIVAIILVILLVAGLVFKDTIVYSMFPDKYIMSSLNKTFKEVNKDLKHTQATFLGDTLSKSTTNDLKLMVNSASSSVPFLNQTLNMFSGMGIELNTATDMKNNAFYLNGKTKFNGRDLVSLGLKLDDTELLVHVPELYNKSFTVPSKDLGRQWNQSVFAQETYMYVDEDLDISFSELMKNPDIIEMDKETKLAYFNALQSLTKNAKFTKAEDKNLLIGDKNVKHKRTIVTLDPRDIKDGLVELIEAFENDNRLKEWKDSLQSTNQGYLIYEFEESLKDIKYEIREYYDIDKIELDIYTRKGKAIEVNIGVTPDIDYSYDTLNLKLGFLGEKNISDDFLFELSVGEDDGKITFTSKSNTSGRKDEIRNDIQFIVHDYGYELVRLNSSAEIDLKKKKDNIKYNLNMIIDDDVSLDIKVNGDFTSSSKTIEYDLHDVNVNVGELYYNENVSFQGSLFLSSREGIKDLPNIEKTEKVKILQLLEYDIYDIMEALEINMENIFYSLGLF